MKDEVDYVFNKKEAISFCESLFGMSCPIGFAANMKKLVSKKENKLQGMKSHDCHVLMTQTLPIALRNTLKQEVREILTKLSEFFYKIS